jgi:hypothetical protein
MRDNDVGCAPPLPRKPITLEVQPRCDIILVLRVGMTHPQDAAPHTLQIAGVDEARHVITSQVASPGKRSHTRLALRLPQARLPVLGFCASAKNGVL